MLCGVKTRATLNYLKSLLIGLRKLGVFLILLAVSTALVSCSLITGDNFALIWQATAPAFMAANLVEHTLTYLGKKLP